jgi:ABC-type sugar transport system substrate-binding protein
MKLKKILSMVVAGAMIAMTMTGCSSSQSESKTTTETESSQAEQGEGTEAAVSDEDIIKVGLITWSTTDSLNVSVQRGFDMYGRELGFEVQTEIFGTMDEAVDCAQNLIQRGCKLIINILPSVALIDLCEENEAYLVCWGNTVSDPELQAHLEASPYWVGTDSVSDWSAATDAMQTLYDNGARHVGLVTQATLNTNHSIRVNAIKDFIEQHDDMELVGEIGVSDSNELSNGVANMLAVYGNMDAIITTGSSSGWAESAIATLESEGVAGTVHYATIDWVDGCGEWLDAGYLDCVSAGQYPDLMFDVINGCNVIRGAYEGNRVLDGCFLTINGKEGYENYIKYIDADGVYPYSLEQLQSVSYYNNPDVTYEDLYNLWAGYSMDSVVAYWEAQE